MTRAPWPAAMFGVASRLLSTTTISYSRPWSASQMSSITRATACSSFMVIIATEIRWLMAANSYSDLWGFSIGAASRSPRKLPGTFHSHGGSHVRLRVKRKPLDFAGGMQAQKSCKANSQRDERCPAQFCHPEADQLKSDLPCRKRRGERKRSRQFDHGCFQRS